MVITGLTRNQLAGVTWHAGSNPAVSANKEKSSQHCISPATLGGFDFSIKYLGKKRKIDGETTDLIADVLLECIYDISSRESVNAVCKIAKKVTEENGGDTIETLSKMKEYITENIEEGETEFIDTEQVADKIFDGKPGMKSEFIDKIEKANVPQKVEVNSYVTKKLASNVKIVTDIGVEVIFPAEYYQNNEYIEFINNDDGTISIQINNIGEVINK